METYKLNKNNMKKKKDSHPRLIKSVTSNRATENTSTEPTTTKQNVKEAPPTKNVKEAAPTKNVKEAAYTSTPKDKRKQMLFLSHSSHKLNIGQIQHQLSQPEFSHRAGGGADSSYRKYVKSLSLDDKLEAQTKETSCKVEENKQIKKKISLGRSNSGSKKILGRSNSGSKKILGKSNSSSRQPAHHSEYKKVDELPTVDSSMSSLNRDNTNKPPSIFVFPEDPMDTTKETVLPLNTLLDPPIEPHKLLHIPDNKSRLRSPSFGKKLRKLTHTSQKAESLLQAAVLDQNSEALEKLLCSGCTSVNHMYPPGVSLLHQACIVGDFFVVKVLLERGADVQMKTWSSFTPLQLAAMRGHFDVAQLLIVAGADVDDVVNGHQGV